jgi:hypothetical protein
MDIPPRPPSPPIPNMVLRVLRQQASGIMRTVVKLTGILL